MRGVAGILFVCLMVLTGGEAFASPVVVYDGHRFHARADGDDVQAVLSAVSSRLHAKAFMDSSVRGSVTAHVLGKPLREGLQELFRGYNLALVWNEGGRTLEKILLLPVGKEEAEHLVSVNPEPRERALSGFALGRKQAALRSREGRASTARKIEERKKRLEREIAAVKQRLEMISHRARQAPATESAKTEASRAQARLQYLQQQYARLKQAEASSERKHPVAKALKELDRDLVAGRRPPRNAREARLLTLYHARAHRKFF